MSRYSEKVNFDVWQEKIAEDAERRKWARRDFCERCEDHNENCPYYDADEETWDCDECFSDKGE